MITKTFIIDSFKEMWAIVAGFAPTLITLIAVLIVGLMLARAVSKLIPRLVKEVHLDRVLKAVGVDSVLHRGGIKKSTGDILGSLSYYAIALMVLVMSLRILGYAAVDQMLDQIFAYIPSVIAGVTALVFGLVFAGFVAALVRVVAGNVGLPAIDMLGKVAKYAVIIFAVTVFLKELGLGMILEGHAFHILFGGIVFAMSLAFGLAGREKAEHYLETFKK